MENSNEYRLSLVRFKGVDKQEISFPFEGIILLDGRSGVGKTTILDALSFVLYDNAKNSCYPRSERNSKKKNETTSVQLIFPVSLDKELANLIIYRQRRPNLLRVKGSYVDLADESAQFYLNKIFGPFNGWLAGGYLKQSELCAFLSMSSQEKLTFLQELSLPDSFDTLLNRASEKIKLTSQQKQQASNSVQIYRELYLQKFNLCPPEVKEQTIWTIEELQNKCQEYQLQSNDPIRLIQSLHYEVQTRYTNQLSDLRNQISQEQIHQTKLQEAQKIRQSLIERIEQIEKQYNEISISDNDILILEKEIEHLSEQIIRAQHSERRTQLLAAKSEIDRRINNLPVVESSSYSLVELDRFEQILKGPKETEIQESLTHVDEMKNYLQQKSQYLKTFSQYSERQQIKDSIEQLQNQLKEYPTQSVSTEIDELNRRIWSLQLHQKKFQCPECSINVYLNNGKLEKCPSVDHENLNMDQLIRQKNQLELDQSKFNLRSSIENKIQDLTNQLKIQPEIDLPEEPQLNVQNPYNKKSEFELPNFIYQFETQLKDLQSVPNISIQEERKKIEIHQEKEHYERDSQLIAKELSECEETSNIESSVSSLEQLRQIKRNELIDARSKYQQKKSLESNIHQYKQQFENILSELPDETKLNQLNIELTNCEEKSRKYLNQILSQEKLFELITLYQQHEEMVNLEQALNLRAGQLQKIKSILITAEYIILDSILNQLNTILGEVLSQLFQEPISISLRSLKQLKTNDRIKPVINLEIIFKGAEFSNLSEMSGGEKSRVSLALVIAFSQLGKFPFLLLDESLSTLDVVSKEFAISTIRKYLNSKLTIAVNHDTNEGIYDSIIQLF